jgi:hypothetical protein
MLIWGNTKNTWSGGIPDVKKKTENKTVTIVRYKV